MCTESAGMYVRMYGRRHQAGQMKMKKNGN